MRMLFPDYILCLGWVQSVLTVFMLAGGPMEILSEAGEEIILLIILKNLDIV